MTTATPHHHYYQDNHLTQATNTMLNLPGVVEDGVPLPLVFQTDYRQEDGWVDFFFMQIFCELYFILISHKMEHFLREFSKLIWRGDIFLLIL